MSHNKRSCERFEMASQEHLRQLENRYCRFREYLNGALMHKGLKIFFSK
jgi:hypothetical protein